MVICTARTKPGWLPVGMSEAGGAGLVHSNALSVPEVLGLIEQSAARFRGLGLG